MGLVQLQTYRASGDLSAHTITLNTPATAGNTLIAMVTSNAVITTPSGWTKITSSLNFLDIGAYRITTVGGESSVTFTVSAARALAVTLYEFDDIAETLTIGSVESVGASDIQFPATTATASSRLFALIGLTPADTGAALGWTGGSLNSNKQSIHADATSETHSYFGSFTDMVAGNSLRPVATPGSGSTIQGILFTVARTGVSAVYVVTGSDQTITTSETATISASASGGTAALSYNWTQTDGPIGSFADATSSSTVFTPSATAGTCTLQISVTDGADTATDVLVITVQPVQTHFIRTSGTWQSPEGYLRQSGLWS